MSSKQPSVRVLRSVLGVTVPLLLNIACGTRSDTDFTPIDDDAASGGMAGSAGAAAGAGARGGEDSPPPPGGNAGSFATGGTGVGVGGAAPAGGTGSEAGSAGSSVAGSSVGGGVPTAGAGAAGAPNRAPVQCGDEVCDRFIEFCCAGLGGFACVPEGEDCGGAVLNCTSSAECSGGVCCLDLRNLTPPGSICQASCGDPGNGQQRQLCTSDAECPSGSCRDTVFGVGVCRRGGGAL